MIHSSFSKPALDGESSVDHRIVLLPFCGEVGGRSHRDRDSCKREFLNMLKVKWLFLWEVVRKLFA